MRSNFHSRDFSDRNLGDAVINHILTASAKFPCLTLSWQIHLRRSNLEEEIIDLWHYVCALKLKLKD